LSTTRSSRLNWPGLRMTGIDEKQAPPQLTKTEDNEAIRHLKREIAGGKHWYLALLESIGLWNTAGETSDGRGYNYLIAGEAFDWLVLAERLCQAIDGLLPATEKTALLFNGEPPIEMPSEEFKELIGSAKYCQYLNYFYGITVEEALVLAVEAEIRKERRSSGYYRERDTTNEAYRRIYGTTKTFLLRRFRREKDYPQLKSIGLTELKEFTYWLFKHRLKMCDKAKVASDTKKALDWLNAKGSTHRINKHDLELECIDIMP